MQYPSARRPVDFATTDDQGQELLPANYLYSTQTVANTTSGVNNLTGANFGITTVGGYVPTSTSFVASNLNS